MKARIYQPARTAMQSGVANTKGWLLEYVPAQAKKVEPLMGWTSSGDMRQQLKLKFDTKEEAVAYAKKHGLDVQVTESRQKKIKPKSYAENFK